MSNSICLPINFGKLSMIMIPHFLSNKKLDYVEIEIRYDDTVLYPLFELKDQIESIDTTKRPKKYPIAVNGELYLDLSKEKIIFEGLYFDDTTHKKGSEFWLEVIPDYTFSKARDISSSSVPNLKCPAYPASIGSVQFSIEPASVSSGTIKDKSDQTDINFDIFQLEPDPKAPNGEPLRTKYLTARLAQGMKITGIDTSDTNNPHLSDFIGDIGFVRNRAYIDGDLKIKDTVCCSFYLEMGV